MIRSYYLLLDGKTITTEHPDGRYKSVARAENKRDAEKVFRSRFVKNEDGSYGDRIAGACPRRITVRPDRKPTASAPSDDSGIEPAITAEAAEAVEPPPSRTWGTAPYAPLQTYLHIAGLKLVLPQNTQVTLTTKGEVLVTYDPREHNTENDVDLAFAGKVD